MTALYSNEYAKGYNTSNGIIAEGDNGGKLKVAYAKHASGAVITSGDTIELFKLPKGARVHNLVMATTALGAGTFNVGHRATKDEDGATLAENHDAFLASIDPTSASINDMADVASLAGQFLKLGDETTIYLTATVGTSSAGTIKVACYYTID